MSKHYLILGAEGQLGKEFVRVLALKGCRVTAPGEKDSNITDALLMKKLIGEARPDVVINCAAYNQVDAAEDQPEVAMKVNTEAPGNLARICKEAGAFFVHYSSDYVFDGSKGDLYTEDDKPSPLNVYGKSKLSGEQAVLGSYGGNSLVLRTSWVIGKGKQNFLYKLSEWALKNHVLKITADEVSVPTFAHTMVEMTFQSLEKGLHGLYHLTNSGYASRYELARYYVLKKRLANIVIPVPLSNFNTKAKRPTFAAMNSQKLASALGVTIPTWQQAMDEFLEEGKR